MNRDAPPLVGKSGCTLRLSEHDTVRKTSPMPAYNIRLERQAQLQDVAYRSGIATPQVLEQGIDPDGLFYFEMPLVSGTLGSVVASQLDPGEPAKVDAFKDAIRGPLLSISSCTSLNDIVSVPSHSKAIHNKLEPLLCLPEVTSDRNLSQLSMLLTEFDWGRVESGPCHGDFALDNLIFGPNGLVVIDFHDIYLSSPRQDTAKLLVSLYLASDSTASRHFPADVTWDLLVARDQRDSSLTVDSDFEEVTYLAAAHILRMVPYISESKDLERLSRAALLLLNDMQPR